MSTLANAQQPFGFGPFGRTGKRLLPVLIGVVLAALVPGGLPLLAQALSDAFLQVTVFVAVTLAVVFAAERFFAVDLGELMGRARHWQTFYAALLGAMPGCGGAIIVVTQFTRGAISFGSVVSVLVATMGDAAFLLIARDPAAAAIVLPVSLLAGAVTGMIVDKIHGPQFLRPEPRPSIDTGQKRAPSISRRVADHLWLALIVLTLPVSIGIAFQADVNQWFGPLAGLDPVFWIGVMGGIFSLVLWLIKQSVDGQDLDTLGKTVRRRVIDDTVFVTAWVVAAFFSYELVVHVSGVDVAGLFGSLHLVMPLIGILVGFIPGCGPQIVVTTLYLSGAIPLSAQFANAIANDGDALFPAIALAPRAALVATLYSAIPAFIVGYGWLFLFERF